jgi:hypothetical protein
MYIYVELLDACMYTQITHDRRLQIYNHISSSEQELKDSMMNELNTVYKSGSRKWNTSSLGMEIHVLSMLRAKRRIMHVFRTDSEIEKKGGKSCTCGSIPTARLG